MNKKKTKTKKQINKQTNKQTNKQKQINQTNKHKKKQTKQTQKQKHKCPMMIFMMQNVEQMMTSLSLYVLLQIKLNKYIKINIY